MPLRDFQFIAGRICASRRNLSRNVELAKLAEAGDGRDESWSKFLCHLMVKEVHSGTTGSTRSSWYRITYPYQ
jgi:hypothetical protein